MRPQESKPEMVQYGYIDDGEDGSVSISKDLEDNRAGERTQANHPKLE